MWKFPYVAENGEAYSSFSPAVPAYHGRTGSHHGAGGSCQQKESAVNGYKTLEKPGSKWHIHGWFCMLGCCLLMMYYDGFGWMTDYFIKLLPDLRRDDHG
ncbi:MAG: hypothetical protein ACLTK0_08435 [Anaerovoracaceae bacterium]